MAQPVSPVLGNLVKVAGALRTETIMKGTSQYKQIRGSKSYWQGYDIGI